MCSCAIACAPLTICLHTAAALRAQRAGLRAGTAHGNPHHGHRRRLLRQCAGARTGAGRRRAGTHHAGGCGRDLRQRHRLRRCTAGASAQRACQDLGIDAQAPAAFADTLHLGESGRLEFLPRLAYGDYLRSELDTAIGAAQASIVRLSQEAVAVERARRGFRVFLANGDAFQTDQVVLAVGALQPQALAGIGPRLSVHPRYIGWPWQGDALSRLSPTMTC